MDQHPNPKAICFGCSLEQYKSGTRTRRTTRHVVQNNPVLSARWCPTAIIDRIWCAWVLNPVHPTMPMAWRSRVEFRIAHQVFDLLPRTPQSWVYSRSIYKRSWPKSNSSSLQKDTAEGSMPFTWWKFKPHLRLPFHFPRSYACSLHCSLSLSSSTLCLKVFASFTAMATLALAALLLALMGGSGKLQFTWIFLQEFPSFWTHLSIRECFYFILKLSQLPRSINSVGFLFKVFHKRESSFVYLLYSHLKLVGRNGFLLKEWSIYEVGTVFMFNIYK